MRIATLNLGTLAGRLDWVFEAMATKKIDVLCLQETRVTEVMAPGIILACRQRGLQCFFGHHQRDAAGVSYGTNAVIAKWPIVALRSPPGTPNQRCQYFALHEAARGPIVCANIHGPHTRASQHALLREAHRHLGTFGRRCIIIGDFNCTPDEAPVTELLGSCSYELFDPEDAISELTSRPSGDRRGRHIDYAIASRQLRSDLRCQWRGPADHDVVSYAIPLEKRTDSYVLTRPGFIPPAKSCEASVRMHNEADYDNDVDDNAPDCLFDDDFH